MKTKTITYRNNEKFEVVTNGVGTAFNVPVFSGTPDNKNYTKYEKHAVYLKPTYGSLIGQYKTWTTINGTGYNSSQESEPVYRWTQTPDFSTPEDETYGCIYLGSYEIYQYDDIVSVNDDDDDTEERIYNAVTHIEFSKTPPYDIDLKVWGSEPKLTKDIKFTQLDNLNQFITYIAKYSENTTFDFTNAVVFNQEQKKIDSGTIISDQVVTLRNSWLASIDDVTSGKKNLWISSGITTNHIQCVIINDDNVPDKITNVYLYINSNFAILSPYFSKSVSKPLEQDGILKKDLEETYYNVAMLDEDGLISIHPVAAIKFVSCIDSKEPFTEEDVTNEQYLRSIMEKHKWVYYTEVTKNGCIAMYVDDSNYASLTTFARVLSPYIRYTKYWIEFDVGSGDIAVNATKIVHESSSVRRNRNTVFRPIFKPFAEAHLVCHSCGPDQPLGPTLNESWIYKKYVMPMKVSIPSQFRTEVVVDAKDNWGKNGRLIWNYNRIISPFKNEYYFVHGGRIQFDQRGWDSLTQEERDEILQCGVLQSNRRKSFGCNCISVSEDKRLYYSTVNDLHVLNSFYNPNCCIGFYNCCCFGQGIQRGIQRAGDIAGIHTNTYGLPLHTPDIFFKFGSCATHFGNGSTHNGNQNDSQFVEYALKNLDDNYSYSGFSTLFNNALQSVTSKQYAGIYKFCKNNFKHFITWWLKPEMKNKKEILEYTFNEVMRDIQNNGQRYFCVLEEDVDTTGSSDGTLQGTSDQKVDVYADDYNNPPICDTLIGWLKENLIGTWFVPRNYYKSPFTNRAPGTTREERKQYIREHKPGISSITDLKETLMDMQDEMLGDVLSDDDANRSGQMDNLCCKPWSGCSGMFTRPDAELFTNPDKYVNSWLTSDDDIEYLSELTKTKNYNEIDLEAYKLKVDTEFREHNEEYNT